MDDLSTLLDAIVGGSIDKEHSEELAKHFFEELNDNFKVPTVGYAIFIILANTYDIIASQDESGALFFKKLMLDCVESLGGNDE